MGISDVISAFGRQGDAVSIQEKVNVKLDILGNRVGRPSILDEQVAPKSHAVAFQSRRPTQPETAGSAHAVH